MALVYKDRVKETTTTTGTGTLTLAGAATGYQAFSAIGNANTCIYALEDANGTGWEVGIGTYTLSGTTLARTTILASSNSGSAISLSAGTHSVFVTWDASRSGYSTNKGLVVVKNSTSTTQSFSNGTHVKVAAALNQEDIDTNGWWDSTNKRFTPTIAGRYHITFSAQLAAIAASKIVQGSVYKNGSSSAYGPVSEGRSGVISVVVDSDGDDYFEMYLFHNDDTSRSTEPEYGRVWFMAYLIEAM